MPGEIPKKATPRLRMVSNGFGIHGSSVAVRCVSAGRLRLGPSTGPGILEDGVERVALLGGTGVREGKYSAHSGTANRCCQEPSPPP